MHNNLSPSNVPGPAVALGSFLLLDWELNMTLVSTDLYFFPVGLQKVWFIFQHLPFH